MMNVFFIIIFCLTLGTFPPPDETAAPEPPARPVRTRFLADAEPPARSVRIRLPADAAPAVRTVAALLTRRIEERCPVRVSESGTAGLDVELAIEPGIGTEGYLIMDTADHGVRIAGNDARGLLYGAGRFLRTSAFGAGGFTPGRWRGRSVPDCPVRGIYFAVHGGNFYEAAPAAEVERYVEDLALWGMNAVACHFPPQQFAGFDDPAALHDIERIRLVLAAAKRLGIDAGLLEAVNCGFTSAPADVRYEPFPDDLKRRGHAGILVCPGRPAGRAFLLGLWSGLLDRFRDVGLDFFVSWPYDEGGCGCAACQPWGSNGFLALSRDVAGLVRARFPAARFILSTWMFDTPADYEWDGLSRALAADGAWIDAIMADAHEDFPAWPLAHPVPGGKPLLNFPEISMWGQAPWGGFGANPLPDRFERLWNQAARKLSGGFPYSEGIYEDLNKAIALQFYWDKTRRAMDTVREYAAGEFSPGAANDVAVAVRTFEENHLRDRVGPDAEDAAARLEALDPRLSPAVREGARWRMLLLRARIDREVLRRGGKIEGPELAAAFEELTAIYHAEGAQGILKPPRIEPAK